MQHIAVIGSGTMGGGIAQVLALAGYRVTLYDLEMGILDQALDRIQKSIDKGVVRGKVTAVMAVEAKAAITLTTSLAEAAEADLVIEAAPEKLALKRKIFRELDAHARPETILATNTSSLSINALAAASYWPLQTFGMPSLTS